MFPVSLASAMATLIAQPVMLTAKRLSRRRCGGDDRDAVADLSLRESQSAPPDDDLFTIKGGEIRLTDLWRTLRNASAA